MCPRPCWIQAAGALWQRAEHCVITRLEATLQQNCCTVLTSARRCGSAFEVAVVSAQFEGKALLERHRMVRRRHCPAATYPAEARAASRHGRRSTRRWPRSCGRSTHWRSSAAGLRRSRAQRRQSRRAVLRVHRSRLCAGTGRYGGAQASSYMYT